MIKFLALLFAAILALALFVKWMGPWESDEGDSLD